MLPAPRIYPLREDFNRHLPDGRTHGFAGVGQGRLKTIRITGLWARIRAGPSPPLPVAGALYLGVVVLAPLLRLLPRDIILHFYRKR